MLERLFQISGRGSSLGREVLGGTVTFMTMAYIISVQPYLMSQGAPQWAPLGGDVYFSLMVATCLISALASVLMAFFANLPVALAPGMGINILFVAMIGSVAATPQAALAVILVSGIIYLVITFFRLRELLLHLVSRSQQAAIVVGIGLFILVLGLLYMCEVPGSYNLLRGEFFLPWNWSVAGVFLLNLAILVLLMWLKVPGALLIGMIAGSAVAAFFGRANFSALVGPVPSIAPTFLQIDLSALLNLALIPYVAIFLYVNLFDAMASLIGVTRKAGLMTTDGSIPRVKGALMADACGTLGGSLVGISPIACYIESSAGVISGARTGFSALVTAGWFLAATLFTPLWFNLASNVIIGPVLIVVGVLMLSEIRKIDWKDWSEAVPAILTMAAMVLMLTINDGLAAAFISYPICKLLAGKGKTLSWLNWTMAVISVAMVWLVHTSFR